MLPLASEDDDAGSVGGHIRSSQSKQRNATMMTKPSSLDTIDEAVTALKDIRRKKQVNSTLGSP